MSVIKVVALNDDNHERSYVTIGSYYSNCAAFARECLLKPHLDTYEVREVYICDPQGALAELSDDDFQIMFDLVDQDPVRLFAKSPEQWNERNKAFELFWNNGEEWRYA